jgi:hypothetical protein
MVSRRWWCVFISLGLVLGLGLGSALGEQPEAKEKIKAIQVKLKVQSITKDSFYMGDVWVAPAQFTDAQAGKQYVGDARAFGQDDKGNQVEISPKWQPSDPTMVEVTPNLGHKVKLTVRKSGQSYLTVTADGISKNLTIKATYEDKALHVEISQ